MWPFTKGKENERGDNNDIDKCPVDEKTRSEWLKRNNKGETSQSSSAMAFLHSQNSLESRNSNNNSSSILSKERQISTIPRFGAKQDSNDSSSSTNWVYPSPSQFFSAMERKNHNPNAKDMNIVVPIHNAVNERAWNEILKWEKTFYSNSFNQCGGPQLVSFKGKPKELTWKAWFKSIIGFEKPFDRHDWIIDRCGKRITYIIDFYSGKTDSNGKKSLSFYLDVRPSPGSFEGIQMRFKKFFFR